MINTIMEVFGGAVCVCAIVAAIYEILNNNTDKGADDLNNKNDHGH